MPVGLQQSDSANLLPVYLGYNTECLGKNFAPPCMKMDDYKHDSNQCIVILKRCILQSLLKSIILAGGIFNLRQSLRGEQYHFPLLSMFH